MKTLHEKPSWRGGGGFWNVTSPSWWEWEVWVMWPRDILLPWRGWAGMTYPCTKIVGGYTMWRIAGIYGGIHLVQQIWDNLNVSQVLAFLLVVMLSDNLTNFNRKQIFIVYLWFNPIHEQRNVLWSRKSGRFLVVYTITPMIFVPTTIINLND